jgi:stage III sporulation protein AA
MENLFAILPEKIKELLLNIPTAKIYEIRLRANSPLVLCISGRNVIYDKIIISRVDLDNLIHKASNYAIYSVNEQIKNGFITIRGGIRIGIAGEVIQNNSEILTIKNFQGICIRIPNEVKNCSYPALPYIFEGSRPLKTLIIAPPGAGKTTFLRDLAVQVSDKYPHLNTLILDERSEIAANYLGDNQLSVGHFTDVITGGSKIYGFENGIRSMRPDVIITDEVATKEDAEMLKIAARSGVIIFASVHANDIDEIRSKP